MLNYISFRNKKLYRLHLNIKPDIEFGIVLNILEEIQNTEDSKTITHIRFALLELLNNSLRAHKKNYVDDAILLNFAVVEKDGRRGIKIVLEDSGRGFDPSDLPYNIYAPLDSIDLQSESFQLYREMHNQQRFGMGLVVTRKTFHHFRLEFIDFNGESAEYTPETVRGTRITLIHWGEE